MIRILLVAGLAAGLTACASPHGAEIAAAPLPLLPTEQHPIAVTHAPDEVVLAAHVEGLSSNQSAALEGLVSRWRDLSSEAPFVIKAPADGDGARMAASVRRHLEGLGVAPTLIETAAVEAAPGARPVIAVGFERYQAVVEPCGREWTGLTHNAANLGDPNFGCAAHANLAAMIANPQDLVRPATMTPADAARREVILGKYRTGASTSTVKDDQANGAVSTAVQ